MKLTSLCIFLLIYFTSCTNSERGTLEVDALSKKIFESLKNNDFNKFKALLPTKSSYKKYYQIRGLNTDSAEVALKQLQDKSAEDFNTVYNAFNKWDDAVYANANEQTDDVSNANEVIITLKFKSGTQPYKINYRAIKINSRWFYSDELRWVVKTDTTAAAATLK